MVLLIVAVYSIYSSLQFFQNQHSLKRHQQSHNDQLVGRQPPSEIWVSAPGDTIKFLSCHTDGLFILLPQSWGSWMSFAVTTSMMFLVFPSYFIGFPIFDSSPCWGNWFCFSLLTRSSARGQIQCALRIRMDHYPWGITVGNYRIYIFFQLQKLHPAFILTSLKTPHRLLLTSQDKTLTLSMWKYLTT